MKKIQMLETKNGSRDGIAVDEFLKDETYIVDDSLAQDFVTLKVAKVLEENVDDENGENNPLKHKSLNDSDRDNKALTTENITNKSNGNLNNKIKKK